MAEELTEKEFYLPHITYRIDSAERNYKKLSPSWLKDIK